LSSPERQKNHLASQVLGLFIAISIALIVIYLGPPGGERPAHLFQLSLFAKHGFVFWDNYWYLGGYSFIGYSLIFYPLASVFSIYPVVVASLLVGLWATFRMLLRLLPKSFLIPWLAISITWPLELLSGAYPYIVGQALVVLGIALVIRDRDSDSFAYGDSGLSIKKSRATGRLAGAIFVLIAIAIWATSPLDLYFLDLFVIARWIDRMISWFRTGDRRIDRSRLSEFLADRFLLDKYLVSLGVVSIVEILTTFAFPSGAYYPFWWTDLTEALIFVVIVWVWLARIEAQKTKVFISVFAAACLFAFFVRSELGANATRISDISVFIVVALYVRYRDHLSFKLGVVVIAYAIFWGSSTLVSAPFDHSASSQSAAQYWKPAISFLKDHLKAGQRVEVVDSASHFGDYFLPESSIPIVRGWFRQDDFPTNEILYQNDLSAKGYLQWLKDVAAAYVVLPGGPYDFSSVKEAKVVKSLGESSSCLHKVFAEANATIYRVCDQGHMVSGAKVVSFGVNSLTVLFNHPGNYRLSLHFTPYFLPSKGCIYRLSDGLVGWDVPTAGVQTVRFQLTMSRLVGEIFEQNERVCAG
jgi:uncharacterized membrane protein